MTLLKPLALCAGLMGLLAGCSSLEGSSELGVLDRIRIGAAADALVVLPRKPLVMPEDLTVLPEPGGESLAEPNPARDVAQALPQPTVLAHSGAYSSAESALLQSFNAGATPENISELIAQEHQALMDTEINTLYYLITGDFLVHPYADQKLNARAEVHRLRAAGINTVAMPSTKPFQPEIQNPDQ